MSEIQQLPAFCSEDERGLSLLCSESDCFGSSDSNSHCDYFPLLSVSCQCCFLWVPPVFFLKKCLTLARMMLMWLQRLAGWSAEGSRAALGYQISPTACSVLHVPAWQLCLASQKDYCIHISGKMDKVIVRHGYFPHTCSVFCCFFALCSIAVIFPRQLCRNKS